MEIKVIDSIFKIHAFHQGDTEKPFAIVLADFRTACKDIERVLHNDLIIKYNTALTKAMKNLGWDSIYAVEIIDEIRKELK